MKSICTFKFAQQEISHNYQKGDYVKMKYPGPSNQDSGWVSDIFEYKGKPFCKVWFATIDPNGPNPYMVHQIPVDFLEPAEYGEHLLSFFTSEKYRSISDYQGPPLPKGTWQWER